MPHAHSKSPPGAGPLPRLETGDRLNREEFHRRYELRPDIRKAELIDGVVYVSSPLSGTHGEPHATLIGCLVRYSMSTPGVSVADNTTVFLGPRDEPQPDALMRVERGGQTELTEDGYILNAPELAGEVAVSSVRLDTGPRLEAYRRAGIREYIVWRVKEGALDWYRLRGERYEPLTPGEGGVLKSEIFPGLWLDREALLDGDLERVLATLEQGLASAEHEGFSGRG